MYIYYQDLALYNLQGLIYLKTTNQPTFKKRNICHYLLYAIQKICTATDSFTVYTDAERVHTLAVV